MDTVEELIQYFNNTYGIEKEWPKTFEVSAALYGKVCQKIFKYLGDTDPIQELDSGGLVIGLCIGPNKGILYKNVELIIK